MPSLTDPSLTSESGVCAPFHAHEIQDRYGTGVGRGLRDTLYIGHKSCREFRKCDCTPSGAWHRRTRCRPASLFPVESLAARHMDGV
jgi:hypothetical protein